MLIVLPYLFVVLFPTEEKNLLQNYGKILKEAIVLSFFLVNVNIIAKLFVFLHAETMQIMTIYPRAVRAIT